MTRWARRGVIAAVLAVLLVAGGLMLASYFSRRPANLGVREGRLAACPASPNCVSSQAERPEHRIAALTYDGRPEDAMARLRSIVEAQPRTKVVTAENDYLYAEFRSAVFGFVDDVEFWLDRNAGEIHVRSASRVGRSDLGVNRARVESLRQSYGAADANKE